MDAPCYSKCGTLKNTHCSIAMSAEHGWKFAALHRQWRCLHMSEKFSSGMKNPKQTKKHSFAQMYLFIETVSQVSHVVHGPLVFWCSKFFKSYWTLLLGTFASYFIFVQKNDAQGECQIPMEEEEDVKAGRGEGACRMIHLISIL